MQDASDGDAFNGWMVKRSDENMIHKFRLQFNLSLVQYL